MIQSAMMFALGACVSGLAVLMFAIAFVRRARRVTEKRLLASVATRRVEFETERDELRARHAIATNRLEQEIGRILDRATADRLEADLKQQEAAALSGELAAREHQLEQLEQELAATRAALDDLERRHSEAREDLRWSRQALEGEAKRVAAVEATLVEEQRLAAERLAEISEQRSEVEALRSAVTQLRFHAAAAPIMPVDQADYELGDRPWAAAERRDATAEVVELPTRRAPPVVIDEPEPAERSEETDLIDKVAHEVHRIAGEVGADLTRGIWRAHALLRPVRAPVNAPSAVSEEDRSPVAAVAGRAPDVRPAENRFVSALTEIRALRRTGANPPGE